MDKSKIKEFLEESKKLSYVNYHKHCHYSNISTIDSAIKPIDYINRALELSQKMVFSTQHGVVNGYHEYYDLINATNDVIQLLKDNKEREATKLADYIDLDINKLQNTLSKNNDYKLKFGFGVEAYMVKDTAPELKDRTNSHIILLARNKTGFREINRIVSKANAKNMYYKPRVSLDDVLTLNKENVLVTTACVGSFIGKYDSGYTAMLKKLKDRLGDSLFLEVQYHHTEKQKEYNKKILKLSKKFDIQLIAGTDSHMIYPEQEKDRDELLKSQGLVYEDEQGWFLDYPSANVVAQRFFEQGILAPSQIINSIKNTIECLDFKEIKFDKKKIKLPKAYPELTQKETNNKYKKILKENFEKYKTEIPKSKHKYYMDEIKKESKVVTETKMTDYFLSNERIIRRGIEKYGGRLSKTGRGSAVSFFTNKLLGFTDVDRIKANTTMFPARFMSKSRILETKSLPDIDFNTADPDPFIKAQKDIMGEDHSYYMLAYGTLKVLSSWKLYAKAKGVSFDIANKVSKDLKLYKMKMMYSSDPKSVDPGEFVDKKYKKMFEESQKFNGVIISVSPSPCSHLLYDKKISEEVGLTVVGSKKNRVVCAAIDGGTADEWKYLKNDLLTVSVWDVNYRVLQKIGKEDMTVNDLLEITDGDEKTWDIYKYGNTIGINQVEKDKTMKKCKRYAPKNETELSAFVAAIRPGFKSMLEKFLEREDFEYGIKAFDELVQTEEIPNSFIIYQEQVMATLIYAGFKQDKTYSLIKAISKKKEGVLEQVEEKFKKGFIAKGNSEDDADKIWQLILDNSRYSFNASHSYCVAIDSLFGAYLKAHYPFEFFEVMLDFYSEKANADKISAIKTEMSSGFNIKSGEMKFGLNNKGYNADKENRVINQSLLGVKYLNEFVAEKIYEVSKGAEYKSFLDLFLTLKEIKGFNKTHVEKLILIDYFREFGSRKRLLAVHYIHKFFWKTIFRKSSLSKKFVKLQEKFEDKFNIPINHADIKKIIKKNAGNETQKSYTQMNREKVFQEILNLIPDEDIDFDLAVATEYDLLGKVITPLNDLKVAEVMIHSRRNKSVQIKSLNTGRQLWAKYQSTDLSFIKIGDLISLEGFNVKNELQKGKIRKVYYLLNPRILSC